MWDRHRPCPAGTQRRPALGYGFSPSSNSDPSMWADRPSLAPHQRVSPDLWIPGSSYPEEGLPATSPHRKLLDFADKVVLQHDGSLAFPGDGDGAAGSTDNSAFKVISTFHFASGYVIVEFFIIIIQFDNVERHWDFGSFSFSVSIKYQKRTDCWRGVTDSGKEKRRWRMERENKNWGSAAKKSICNPLPNKQWSNKTKTTWVYITETHGQCSPKLDQYLEI